MMKDKLYKNGHKGIYYRARRFFLLSLLAATLVAGVSVSTYIAYTESVKAEETSQVDDTLSEDETTSSGSFESLLYK